MAMGSLRPFSLRSAPVPLLAALCLLLQFVSLAALSTEARAKGFPFSNYNYYVTSYEQDMAKLAKGQTKSKVDLEKDLAAAEQAGNARLAVVSLEILTALSPKDKTLWLDLARQLAAAQPINDEDGYRLPAKLIGAALKSYQLAATAPEEAEALALAAQGFARREDWRPALQAYKESLRLVENDEYRATYEDMRLQHGFRITDYKVQNDATPPRACFELSETLSRTVSDFAPYISVEPDGVGAVSAEGSRLCVEGLAYGKRYHIVARKGLPSAVDEDLPKDFEFDFYVRDRSPSVRFASRSYVLPRTGQNGVPVISVNADAISLSLYRIGDRNLINTVLSSNFLTQVYGSTVSEIQDSAGAKVWDGTLETQSPLNQEVTTAFPVSEALGKLTPGLYMMTAQVASRATTDDWSPVATQWFVISDLGLATMEGNDGLHVGVRSIATAAPLAGIDVRLLARNNDVLAAAQTNAEGTATFETGLLNGSGGQEPALVVAQSPENDYSFVDLTQPAFDLSDRGVSGRPQPGLVDAYVYAERGVYRRGETVHVSALLRDDSAKAMPDLPLILVVERPDGVEYSRASLADQGAGGRTLDIPINAVALGGTWRIKAFTDPNGDPVGETSFLVEDYIPDRIEFDLKPLSPVATVGEGARFTVDGRYLFGAPAAGLDLEANVVVSANDQPFEEWKGYRFGLTDERVDSVQSVAADLPQTDISGHAELDLRLPGLPSTTRPLKADIAVRMREPGGRAVEQTATLPIFAQQAMIGIKPSFDAGSAPEGQPSEFSIIAVDPQGKAIALKNASWTLKRLSFDYQWYNVDGDWRYESITRAAKIDAGTIDINADKPAMLSRPLSWGFYRLEVSAQDVTAASVDFSAGYYNFESSAANTPDTLSVALDKTEARTGDTLNVKIESRYAGKAVLQVINNGLLLSKPVDVPEGGVTVPLTVEKGWGTGAYVLATLYRPMDVEAKRMPARAIGVAWFGIDRAERSLSVELSPVDMMKPRQTLKVPVKIGGLAPGSDAYITVAAVDVGILNLTRYSPPAPDDYYYDQKRLGADLRDLYGSLIDGMQADVGRIRSGGDSGAAFNAPPPTQPPLALFSGIVKVNADSTAEVNFDVPSFNGTVRVMAVAWSADKVGHGVKDVIVRDPIVVAGTLPRFLSFGDSSRFRLDIINAEAPAGDYTLGVSIEGPVSTPSSLTQKVTLGAAGARLPVIVPITATGIGTAKLTARLIGPNDTIIEQDYLLNVKPANPLVNVNTSLKLPPNGGAVTLSRDLIDNMVPGTSTVSLSVGPLPSLDAAGIIRELDRYPYGCSEQTVSRALPLLYLSDLGTAANLDDGLQKRMSDAVVRLINRQSGNGSFGLWSAGDGDSSLWLTSYVTDFLLRAREKGFDVPEYTISDALDFLRNTLGNAPDFEAGKGEDTAYALYVLARAGRAPVGDLKYLADTKIYDFGSAMARAQVAAALAMLGDTRRADQAFAAAVDGLEEERDAYVYRADYGSVLRDASAILALAADSKAEPPVIKAAEVTIEKERAKSRYASTQDMAWMVLAARAAQQQAKEIRLDANGTPQIGALYKLFPENEFQGDYRVTNTGTQPLRAVVSVMGSPKVAEPASANGIRISRQYFSVGGEPVNPASVAQNTRLVVVLEATADSGLENGTFLISDPLPAGFEIENPTLVSSASTAALSWLQEQGYATYTEFRDDRFVAYFNQAPLKLAYMVRAVAPGRYIHPGASVEDMYRPMINGRTETGEVTVTEP